jgi:sarcosine oxidase subunit beta
MADYDAAIIGGGLWGLSLAWHLASGGKRVVVLEQRHTGSGASSRNVGRVRSIQLKPELTLLSVAAQAKHARLARELGKNTLFWRAGYIWVLYDNDEVERFRSLLPMLKDAGSEARLLNPGETLDVMPILEGGEAPSGSMYGPRDAIVHHDAVIYAYRTACERIGVTIKEHCPVTGIDVTAGRVSGVQTVRGSIRTDLIVNATGGWSSSVSKLAGVTSPAVPYRREAFVTESTRPVMSAAVTFYSPIEGWFNQTLRGEIVAGSITDEESPGVDHTATPESLERTAALLMRKAPRLGPLRVVRQWAGVYDMTPDRKPLVGESRLPGFYQFCGCNGRGFSLGPILAELLAAEVLTGRRDTLLRGAEPQRFEGASDVSVKIGDYYAGYSKKAMA